MNSNNITKIGNQRFSDVINISDLTETTKIFSTNLGNLTLQSSNKLCLTGTNGIDLVTTSPGTINMLNPIKFGSGISISDQTTTSEIFSSNLGKLTLQCANHLLLNVNNNSKVELSPVLLTINGSGANGILINSISNINLTAVNQINISSTSMNFSNGIYISDATNSIIGTSLTGLTLNSNVLNGGIINLNTYNGTINLNSSQTIIQKSFTLNNQTSFPNNPIPISGTICNKDNKLYFYDGSLWKEIAFV